MVMGGTPIAGWFLFMESLIYKWMKNGGTPIVGNLQDWYPKGKTGVKKTDADGLMVDQWNIVELFSMNSDTLRCQTWLGKRSHGGF